MDEWRHLLPKLHVQTSDDTTSLEPSEDQRALRVPRASKSPFNDRLSVSPAASTIYEEEFHSAHASPIAHRSSVSSNRIPSPLGIARSPPHRPRRPSINTTLALSLNGGKTRDSIQSSAGTSKNSVDEEFKAKSLSVPLSAYGRLENATGPSAVVYETRTISKKYLPPPQAEEEETPWDKALDFDIADLNLDKLSELEPMIAQHLEEAAQPYFSSPPPVLGSPFSRGKTTAQLDLLPVQPLSIRSTQGRNERSSNADEDIDTGTEDEDPEYFCSHAKEASIDDPKLAYCYKCSQYYCSDCWKDQPLHRRSKLGHRQVDAAVAKIIRETLNVGLSEADQAQMHLFDEPASWFGAMKDGDGVVFRDFGRYASMMASLKLEERKRTYPALISFVGETGAGKSSLVKLLVGLKKSKTEDIKLPAQTPVVGNIGASAPTSGDVHLYADPQTFFGECPLLYADCEGLRGGNLDPVGVKRLQKMSMSNQTQAQARTASFDKYVRRRHETAERDIAWATTPEKRTRSYFVENLYPRLLYTFSDVVVFVEKNARVIEEVVQRLATWAEAVIETASNQPVLPHAIIVLNAYEGQDAKLWEVDASTEDLLSGIRLAVDENPTLSKLARKWISKGFRIDSVQSLLLAYYSSIRVVRIPDKRDPSRIHDQIQRLYEEITNSAAGAQEQRHKLRVKLNAERLQPYLQQAFDHFCHDLNESFDFIKASFADGGIPSDFSGNITKLAINVMSQWENKIDGGLLFRELSFIVASCVMLDAVRNGNLGLAGPVFKQYMDHFDETLDDFCEKVWPCEFISSRGRCVNVKAGHAKGHQGSQGQILAAGDYQSEFTAEAHRQNFRNNIFSTLQELLSSLTNHDRALGEGEREAAAKLHESRILGPFYRHFGGAQNYDSTEIEMRSCPLHRSETSDLRQTIFLKPENAGVRVLCLDGGGIRGIIMLETLRQLERDLGGNLRIASFFDVILGTSTGGIIALGLGKKGWSVGLCHKKFQKLATSAFRKHKWFGTEYMEWLVAGFQQGRYMIEPLEDLLRAEYSEDRLFGGVAEDTDYSAQFVPACKVGVIATNTNGTPYLLSNYNRHDVDETAAPYGFLRPEKPEQEIKIWEAARATSAAPRIFKPYGHTESGHTFVDGGVYYNNPIEIALREPNLIWPQSRSRLPDIVLSLGTGYDPRKGRKDKESTMPIASSKGPLSYYRGLLKIAVDHVKHSQRSEEEYSRVREHYNNRAQASSCFMRFNVKFKDGVPKPDSVASLQDLMNLARIELNNRTSEIRYITNRMIASSFYFDPVPDSIKKDAAGTISLQGYILCRFHGTQLHSFGRLLKQRCEESFNSPRGAQHSPCFVLEDRSRPNAAKQVALSDPVIDGMIDNLRFKLDRINITIMNSHAESDIHLRFGSESVSAASNSISGFPRCWDDKKFTPRASALQLSVLRRRLPSRRGRPDWVEPSTANEPILKRYAEETNPGLATDEQLRAVEFRLSDQNVFQSRPTHHELEGSYLTPASVSGSMDIWDDRSRKPPSYHSASLSPLQETRGCSARAPWGSTSTEVFEIGDGRIIHELPATSTSTAEDINYRIEHFRWYPTGRDQVQSLNDRDHEYANEESDMYGPS